MGWHPRLMLALRIYDWNQEGAANSQRRRVGLRHPV